MTDRAGAKPFPNNVIQFPPGRTVAPPTHTNAVNRNYISVEPQVNILLILTQEHTTEQLIL